MEREMVKVGVREFRAHLPQYLEATLPVAVTKHGETIGFYIPTQHHVDKADLGALKKAALTLEALLLSSGVTEEELFEDFRVMRKEEKR